jgi:signal transduction histidine kinase
MKRADPQSSTGSQLPFARVVIAGTIGSVFVLDLATRPEDVTPTFAYTIPIVLCLFESKPRPYVYAAITTILSIIGAVTVSLDTAQQWADLVYRAIAIATQGLVAALVSVQASRRAQLQREIDRQQRFVDVLAHEIRNALTAVGGHAQRLGRLSDKLTADDIAMRADKIRAAAARIEAIIERVQFASSLGNGMVPMERTPIEVNALVRRLVENLREEHAGRPIELQLPPAEAMIIGDEVLVRHAIENVVRNSLHYASARAPIVVSTVKKPSSVQIIVSDSGEGIPAAELPRVREPYFRGTRSKGIAGTGLGLYFVDRIVDGLRGSMSLQSEPGKGTRVTIDLPNVPEVAR